MKSKRLLLHACCATCLLYPYGLLNSEYEVSVFFYNPNIHPYSEYKKRARDIFRVCDLLGIEIIKGEYEDTEWFDMTKGLEEEPEGGKRCRVCFEMRLKKTAITAKEKGFSFFTTTLSVSPYKKSDLVAEIGTSVAKGSKTFYLASDFKKKDGYKKTLELSKKLDVYHQRYCGCIYSIRGQ